MGVFVYFTSGDLINKTQILMKTLYYKFFCRNPRKKLIFYYKRLKKQETKLLQAYFVMEARVLTGDIDTFSKYAERLKKMRKTIESLQEIMRRNKTLIISLK